VYPLSDIELFSGCRVVIAFVEVVFDCEGVGGACPVLDSWAPCNNAPSITIKRIVNPAIFRSVGLRESLGHFHACSVDSARICSPAGRRGSKESM
jgi:hypothetical protein